MSENSSSQTGSKLSRRKIGIALLLPIWVFAGFMAAQIVSVYLVRALGLVDVINPTLLQTGFGALVYAFAIFIVIGLPWLVFKFKTTKKQVGLQRLPIWKDLGVAPLALIAYFILSAVLLIIAQNTLTFIDFQQVQDVGFDRLGTQGELALAFLLLVVIAPFAEELLFRGYLFGKLRSVVPLWLAILITSLLFAVVHGQWNVAIDTFALSIIMCLAVTWTKSLWPAILVHMLKNGIAFYFLFINPIV
jgi:membrane protease YdiL (CAAX protease family)